MLQNALNTRNNEEKTPPLFPVAAIVLAAGLSRRMGDRNKLLCELDGIPLITHVINALLDSTVTEIVMVTGYDEDRIRQAVAGRKLRLVHNRQFTEGLSSSLRCGLEAVLSSAQGAMICLGDMPLATANLLDGLISAFEAQEGGKICVPVVQGRRGNPVLWPRRFFPQMLQSRGDAGARWLLQRHPEFVHEISVHHQGVLQDVDTLDDLKDLS